MNDQNPAAEMNNRTQILFVSHGGGPLPILGDAGHTEMIACLTSLSQKMVRPAAVIVVSAHWEEERVSITSSAHPDLIYDYSGFPKAAYDIRYPCKGEPALALKLKQALRQNGIDCSLDNQRGFDHGLFIPLKIMYPEADIPCVQVSLVNNLSPRVHIDIGRSLQNLEYENLMLIGSGFSFHNLRAFFSPETDDTRAHNESFEQWLIDTCSDSSLNEAEREKQLVEWEQQAPFSRFCHPREEHLLPLHVCYGYAGAPCSEHFRLQILGKKSSMYLWRK